MYVVVLYGVRASFLLLMTTAYVCSYKCVTISVHSCSDGEPLTEAVSRHLYVHLLFFFHRVQFSRILLRQQVAVLAPLVLHDLWEWLLRANVQLQAEVACHDKIAPLFKVTDGKVA